MPRLTKAQAGRLVARRHPEWVEHQRHWRWLADSLEAGNRYRHADYTRMPDQEAFYGNLMAPTVRSGIDALTGQANPLSYGMVVDRNLVPHLRETGDDGKDVYALRLARTPVPRLVGRTVDAHLAKIYAKEVTRTGPKDLEAWWEDVDGMGGPVDRWMDEVVAPLLLTLGQLDLCFDHPEAPQGAVIQTRADQLALKLNDCVASVVLPENMLWWKLDRSGRYEEALVLERCDDGRVHFRHWTAVDSNCYSAAGDIDLFESFRHPFGCVPIVRVFDRRKPRCKNVGQSRYEGIAELQKAVYNARSELILSDVQQSHAQLMGPEEYLQNDSDIPVGPTNVLPMKKGHDGSYTPWEFLDPPKGAQQEVRVHIQDFQDEAREEGALLKPAGMTSGTTTGQSGVSKMADQQDGNAYLAKVAEVLANAERSAAAMALRVVRDGKVSDADLQSIDVQYPKQFDLYSLADLAEALGALQQLAATAGLLPETEGEALKRLVSVALPGLDDHTLGRLHDEVDAFVQSQAAAKADQAEAEKQQQQQAALGATPAESDTGAVNPALTNPATPA